MIAGWFNSNEDSSRLLLKHEKTKRVPFIMLLEPVTMVRFHPDHEVVGSQVVKTPY